MVNTLITYLGRFDEFEEPESQMRRVVGLMHRQVVKVQAEGLYFKVCSPNLLFKADTPAGSVQTNQG